MKKKRLEGRHPHSVIVVAEGVGQDLMGNTGEERDASGNVRYRDIGEFLKHEIKQHFAESDPVNVKVIEPSYLIRSLPVSDVTTGHCHVHASWGNDELRKSEISVSLGFMPALKGILTS